MQPGLSTRSSSFHLRSAWVSRCCCSTTISKRVAISSNCSRQHGSIETTAPSYSNTTSTRLTQTSSHRFHSQQQPSVCARATVLKRQMTPDFNLPHLRHTILQLYTSFIPESPLQESRNGTNRNLVPTFIYSTSIHTWPILHRL